MIFFIIYQTMATLHGYLYKMTDITTKCVTLHVEGKLEYKMIIKSHAYWSFDLLFSEVMLFVMNDQSSDVK